MRASFSFLRNTVELMSIQPLSKAPLQRTVNHLLDDIESRLPDCRRYWWDISRTTCLANQWARVPTPGKVVIADPVPGAKQIDDAEYDSTANQLHVSFRDDTTEAIRLQS